MLEVTLGLPGFRHREDTALSSRVGFRVFALGSASFRSFSESWIATFLGFSILGPCIREVKLCELQSLGLGSRN